MSSDEQRRAAGGAAPVYAQIVNFRLKPGSSRERFVELTQRMAAWLADRPGFVAYELYEGATEWSDRIAWRCEADARAAVEVFRTTPLCDDIVSLVEGDYRSFFGAAVVTR